MRSSIGSCWLAGVDSAQWLFSSTNTAGTLPELGEVERLVEGADVRRPVAEEGHGDARLVPQLEGERGADDPRQPAADHRVGAEVAALDVVEVHRAAVPVRAALELPVELGHHLVRRRALRERVGVRAVRRGDHVAVLERLADADRAGLLADRDVEEARELAGAETLLDHLLETTDQEHLAQKLAQSLLRERHWFLFYSGHRAGSLC